MDYTSLLNELMPQIINALVIIIGFVMTRIGFLAKDYFDDAIKRKLVEQTVEYVRQIGDSLGNPEKFELAKETFIARMNEKGIKVTELEVKVLIESAIAGLKSGWKFEESLKEKPVEPEEVIVPEVTE